MGARKADGFFYPQSCIPLSRRRFLTGVSAGLAAAGAGTLWRGSALAAGTWPDGAVRTFIDHTARRQPEAWRIHHAIRAEGKGLTLEDGRSAVDYLLTERLTETEVSGRRYPRFSLDDEGHRNACLKTLVERDVPLNQPARANGRSYTLHDVAEGAKALFEPAKVQPNELTWSLIALTATVSPIRRAWKNAWGQEVVLADVVASTFGVAEQATRDVRQAWERRAPLLRKGPIQQQFTCGGTHLVYALAAAVRNGYTGSDAVARLGRQMQLIVYRMKAELDLIDRFFTNAPDRPLTEWARLDAKWKFLGHAFEVYNYVLAHQLYRPTREEVDRVEAARPVLGELADAVGRLDLRAVERADRDLAQQIVGDACHAYHGVHLAGKGREA